MKRLRSLMSQLVCCTLVLVLTFSTVPAARAASHPFTDLTSGPYEQVVSTLYDLGIVNGLEPDKFVPGGPVTRAQMAALIMRAIGKSSEAETLKDSPHGFGDVPAGHWATGVISLASRMGIIKGDAGRFYPNDPVNYAQAVTMVVRALGYESQVVGGYPSGYVLKGNDLSLLKGLSFELYGGVSRGEAAVLLYNAIFRAPVADSQFTLSQTHFRRVVDLKLSGLPQYVAAGQQVKLTAIAADQVGNPVQQPQMTYSIISGSAQISGDVVTVTGSGPIVVKAQAGNLSATGTMSVIDSLTVTPDKFQASKGGTVQVSATALSNGQRVTVQPSWTVVKGPATVSETGLVTVNEFGTVVVQASLGSLTATATGQAVGKVTITSKPEYLIPGQNFEFTAQVTDPDGAALSVPVTWSAVGATIDSTSGRITVPAVGQLTVRATASGITQEATVPVLKSIAVVPANPSLMVNKTISFTARGVDGAGKQYDIKPRWDRSNPAVGIIDAEGTFVGTSSGSTEITATLSGLVGRTQLQVSGLPTRASIAAEHATLPTGGGTTTITVKLLDQAGLISPVSEQPISLSVNDANRGSLSRTVVLTRDGVATTTFRTNSTAGPVTITASVPGTTMAAQSVTITSYQPTPSYVQLAATPQPLATGGGVATISATLRDANGFPAPASQTLYVTVSANTTSFGGLTGTTITIPTGQDTGSLSFISSGAAGTVQISGTSTYPVRNAAVQTAAAGAVAAVRIRPIQGQTPVTGLSSLSVQVEVLDAARILRANDNTTRVQLTVSGLSGMPGTQGLPPATYTATASGGVAGFQVPAFAVGTATLTASLVDMPQAPSDTATAEFIPGVMSNLRLSATPASIVADGFSQAQVVAEVVDTAGNVLSAINPLVTFRKVSDGGTTNPLTSTTVQATNGKATLTVMSTRAVGSDVWYATAPGMDTQNLATISTRAAGGDAYTLRVTGSPSYAVGSANTLIVQVVDQQGQLVASDTGRLITASTNLPGVVVLPQTTTTQSGLATFTVTGSQAGSGVISFTTSGLPVPAVSSILTFGTSGSGSGSAGAAYSLYASGSSQTVRVSNSVTIWVRIMDMQGSVLAGENGRQISASVSGNASLSTGTATTSGGMATFTLTGLSAGTATVTFTNPGLPQPSTTLTITITN